MTSGLETHCPHHLSSHTDRPLPWTGQFESQVARVSPLVPNKALVQAPRSPTLMTIAPKSLRPTT